jgi:hypothetical protein
MSGTDLVGLLVLLAVFVFGPLFLMLFGSNRARGPKPALQECPQCGAQNRSPSARCYCCDYEFTLSEPDPTSAPVIQRVGQADTARAKQPTVAHGPAASKAA